MRQYPARIGWSYGQTGNFTGRAVRARPTLLPGIAADDSVAIRDVKLHTGRATLIEDLGGNGQVERVSLLWSMPDRVYLLAGTIAADHAIAIADSVQ